MTPASIAELIAHRHEVVRAALEFAGATIAESDEQWTRDRVESAEVVLDNAVMRFAAAKHRGKFVEDDASESTPPFHLEPLVRPAVDRRDGGSHE